MHIVTGSDDNYVPGVMVLIASAAFHNPQARFTVLDMGISDANRARIDALGARLGVRVSRIEIADDAFADVRVQRAHLTRSTYLRLMIPDLMPDEDRVIYMDCDMVVTGSLAELDQITLGSAPIAAVPCPSPDHVELARYAIARGDYINAGLLVMNLPVWRAERLAAQCLDLLSQDEPLMSEDQSAVNLACRDRIVPLPARFNVYADPSSYALNLPVPTDAVVLHYVVNNKPWNSRPALAKVWQAHAARIADLMPPLRPLPLRKRLSLINRRRRMWLGLLTRRPKYLARRQAAQEMEAGLAQPYLAANFPAKG